jgi:hypothetical protein
MKTSAKLLIVLPVMVVGVIAATSLTAQNPGTTTRSDSEEAALVGDWRGDSICVVRESACRDEEALYHVSRLAGKPGWFALKADKIVDGKPVTMGTSECSYNAPSLECVLPKAVIRLTVTKKTMLGEMTLTGNTLWRKINLKKVAP